MRTIAVVNQKGGCGKTITSINLSAFLAREQRRVLLVDMDPQGHATLGLLTDAVHPSRTMYEVFVEEPGARLTILRDVILTVRENLDVAPADILLSGVPEALAGQIGREDILSDALAGLRDDYDYVIVDCPPSVGLLTFNALKACSEAIVPVDPSFFALHGIGKLLETFDVLAKETGHQIAVRALVTLYTGRTAFGKAVADDIRRHLYGGTSVPSSGTASSSRRPRATAFPSPTIAGSVSASKITRPWPWRFCTRKPGRRTMGWSRSRRAQSQRARTPTRPSRGRRERHPRKSCSPSKLTMRRKSR